MSMRTNRKTKGIFRVGNPMKMGMTEYGRGMKSVKAYKLIVEKAEKIKSFDLFTLMMVTLISTKLRWGMVVLLKFNSMIILIQAILECLGRLVKKGNLKIWVHLE